MENFEKRNGENTRKEWEVIVVKFVFDCVFDDVLQLEEEIISFKLLLNRYHIKNTEFSKQKMKS